MERNGFPFSSSFFQVTLSFLGHGILFEWLSYNHRTSSALHKPLGISKWATTCKLKRDQQRHMCYVSCLKRWAYLHRRANYLTGILKDTYSIPGKGCLRKRKWKGKKQRRQGLVYLRNRQPLHGRLLRETFFQVERNRTEGEKKTGLSPGYKRPSASRWMQRVWASMNRVAFKGLLNNG